MQINKFTSYGVSGVQNKKECVLSCTLYAPRLTRGRMSLGTVKGLGYSWPFSF